MFDLRHPHDSFFKHLMSDPQNVRDFIRAFLPEEMVSNLDLEDLKIIDTEKIDKKYKRYYLDISVSCNLKNRDAEIYLVFEHKSYPDKFTLIQILSYCVAVWESDLKKGINPRPIIPVIFYHGRRSFNLPSRFSDYYEVSEELKKYLLDFEAIIFDTRKYRDEEISNAVSNQYLKVAILIMKHIFEDITKWKEILREVFKIDKEEAEDVLHYIAMGKNLSEKKFYEIIEETGGDKMPSLAERWYKQGVQEGLQKGKQQGMEEGVQKGIREGLYEAIELELKLKFGKGVKKLLNKIRQIEDIEQLKEILKLVAKADSITEIEKALKQ